jgi:hypothetical protein
MRRSDSNRERDSARDNGLGNVFSGMPACLPISNLEKTHRLEFNSHHTSHSTFTYTHNYTSA